MAKCAAPSRVSSTKVGVANWNGRGGKWAKSRAFVASEIYLTLQKLQAKECESI